jgi:hypothetical protein
LICLLWCPGLRAKGSKARQGKDKTDAIFRTPAKNRTDASASVHDEASQPTFFLPSSLPLSHPGPSSPWHHLPVPTHSTHPRQRTPSDACRSEASRSIAWVNSLAVNLADGTSQQPCLSTRLTTRTSSRLAYGSQKYTPSPHSRRQASRSTSQSQKGTNLDRAGEFDLSSATSEAAERG